MNMDDLNDADREAVAKALGINPKTRARRRFTADTRPADIPAAVPEMFWPSRKQYADWFGFVIPDLGLDPDGWWYAFCPLHDPEREAEHPGAMLHFHFGVMRPIHDGCLDGKRAISFSNLMVKIAMGQHGTEMA